MEIRNAHKVSLGNPEGKKQHLENLVVDGRIKLKYVHLKEIRHETGFIWLRVETGGELI
jgi:hypothetical protein